MIKTALGIVGVVVCALAIWESARIGYARSYAPQSLKTNDALKAERATQLLPRDAEVHAARGVILQRTANYADATPELERAAQLRPRDYFLWMMLGVTRDLNDDPAGASGALRQAAGLAPLYAQPHWLLGNLLLRQGELDSGFKELSFAAERQPTLLPNVIDLAWGITKSDPGQTIALLRSSNDRTPMALAIFMASHNQPVAALDQFRSSRTPTIADANQLADRLIESHAFGAAFEVWSKSHCSSCEAGSFINSGFEDEVDLSAQGFGWQIAKGVAGVTLSIDGAQRAAGARSLRVDFQGNTTATAPLVSQLVIVEPNRRYQLSVQSMTKSLVSTAVPVVKVVDAAELKTISQVSINSATSDWHPYTFQFVTGAQTQAVRIILTRDNCLIDPCAAFGTIWLDSFALAKD